MADADIRERLFLQAQELLQRQGRLRTLAQTLRWAIAGSPEMDLPAHGWWHGGRRWLEAVVAPLFTPWALGLVFLGAAFIVLLLALQRLTGSVGEGLIVAGLIAEGFFLVLLWLLLLLAPGSPASKRGGDLAELANDLDTIAADIDTIAKAHEELLQQWQELTASQIASLEHLRQLVEKFHHLPQPGEALTERLELLQQSLAQLTAVLHEALNEFSLWRTQHLQSLVHQELARLLAAAADEAGRRQSPPHHDA